MSKCPYCGSSELTLYPDNSGMCKECGRVFNDVYKKVVKPQEPKYEKEVVSIGKKVTKHEKEFKTKKTGNSIAIIGIICGIIGFFIFGMAFGTMAIFMGITALKNKSYLGIIAIILGAVDAIGWIWLQII